jgi:hypothetical protein
MDDLMGGFLLEAVDDLSVFTQLHILEGIVLEREGFSINWRAIQLVRLLVRHVPSDLTFDTPKITFVRHQLEQWLHID